MNTRRYWNPKDTILFLGQLHSYLQAGFTLDRALLTIQDSYKSRYRISINNCLISIQKGISLSKAVESNITKSNIVFALISQGESSGSVIEAISMSASILEQREQLKKKVFSALIYPVVIAIFSVIMIVGLVRGVIPQIAPILTSLRLQLPLMTRIVIKTSNILSQHGLMIVLLLTILIFLVTYSVKKYNKISYIFDFIILKFPIMGRMINSVNLSVFLRSCGSMLNAGVTVNNAFTQSCVSISNNFLKEKIRNNLAHINDGTSLIKIFNNTKVPPYVLPMITSGEASGTLGQALVGSASILEKEIENNLKKIVSLIEPIMMAGMGTVVGSIALSIMMPIYSISSAIQR